jgi:hypothetical protein
MLFHNGARAAQRHLAENVFGRRRDVLFSRVFSRALKEVHSRQPHGGKLGDEPVRVPHRGMRSFDLRQCFVNAASGLHNLAVASRRFDRDALVRVFAGGLFGGVLPRLV